MPPALHTKTPKRMFRPPPAYSSLSVSDSLSHSCSFFYLFLSFLRFGRCSTQLTKRCRTRRWARRGTRSQQKTRERPWETCSATFSAGAKSRSSRNSRQCTAPQRNATQHSATHRTMPREARKQRGITDATRPLVVGTSRPSRPLLSVIY